MLSINNIYGDLNCKVFMKIMAGKKESCIANHKF